MLPAILALAITAVATTGCDEGQPIAKDFRVAPLKPGGDVNFSEFKGKPVCIYFWATWCGPCKQFAPTLDKLVTEYAPKGIEFMAIASDDRKAVVPFEQKTPHKASVYIDQTGEASAAYGVTGLPTLFVVSADGKIIFTTTGINSTTEAELRAVMDQETAKTKKA